MNQRILKLKKKQQNLLFFTFAMADLLLSGQAHAQDIAAKLVSSTCALNLDNTDNVPLTVLYK